MKLSQQSAIEEHTPAEAFVPEALDRTEMIVAVEVADKVKSAMEHEGNDIIWMIFKKKLAALHNECVNISPDEFSVYQALVRFYTEAIDIPERIIAIGNEAQQRLVELDGIDAVNEAGYI